MNQPINFKKEISGSIEDAILRITQTLQSEGFGVLTRIDLHAKIEEKIGKKIIPTVILGACNPHLAFEAYSLQPDVASLLPCNAVLREVAPGRISVELAKPSALMEILGDSTLVSAATAADQKLKNALDRL